MYSLNDNIKCLLQTHLLHENNSIISAVRHDRMRGGRNKFGPMYKRDRARKLQVGERFVVNKIYFIKYAYTQP